MAVHVTGGYVQLTPVNFSDADGAFLAQGAPGSYLNWENKGLTLDVTSTIVDEGVENVLELSDTWAGGFQFSGYTVQIAGASYPVFTDGVTFFVVTDETANDLIATTGRSNEYNASEPNTFMCFAAGTLIATPDGDAAVETLGVGDEVCLAQGGTARVIWRGQQTVMPHFPLAERLRLVRIRAGALWEVGPRRDLCVTADHALYLDGMLVTAGALVNGADIVWEPMGEGATPRTVFHVETERHEVILAEGVPVETFVDYATRRTFDNYAAYLALYGRERVIEERPELRISSARLVPDRWRKRAVA